MTKRNLIPVTKINHLFGDKSNNIINNNLPRASESRQDMVFKEFYNDRICGIPRRDGFNPFCEVFGGYENPFVLGGRIRMDFPYEI